jgi:hypothetical protein
MGETNVGLTHRTTCINRNSCSRRGRKAGMGNCRGRRSHQIAHQTGRSGDGILFHERARRRSGLPRSGFHRSGPRRIGLPEVTAATARSAAATPCCNIKNKRSYIRDICIQYIPSNTPQRLLSVINVVKTQNVSRSFFQRFLINTMGDVYGCWTHSQIRLVPKNQWFRDHPDATALRQGSEFPAFDIYGHEG